MALAWHCACIAPTALSQLSNSVDVCRHTGAFAVAHPKLDADSCLSSRSFDLCVFGGAWYLVSRLPSLHMWMLLNGLPVIGSRKCHRLQGALKSGKHPNFTVRVVSSTKSAVQIWPGFRHEQYYMSSGYMPVYVSKTCVLSRMKSKHLSIQRHLC